MYIDGHRSGAHPEDQASRRRAAAASRSSTPTSSASRPQRMATIAKALGDPVRLQLVDVLRKHAGKVCVCELVPAVRPLPADRLAPPQGPAPGRDRRLRARRTVGLLLRDPRRAEGAVRMAELTPTSPQSRRVQPGDCCEPEDKPTAAQPTSTAAAAPRRRADDSTVARSRAAARRRRAAVAAARADCRPACRLGARTTRRRRRDEQLADARPSMARRSAAACRPRSPTCTTARPCSTSAPAPAPTC